MDMKNTHSKTVEPCDHLIMSVLSGVAGKACFFVGIFLTGRWETRRQGEEETGTIEGFNLPISQSPCLIPHTLEIVQQAGADGEFD